MKNRNGPLDLQTSGSLSDSDQSAGGSQEELVRRLAERAFHLRGYNWKEDWLQYFCNNHPLFAVCLQHRLHPVNIWMRLVGFIGSVAIGLCITNVVWLLFFYGQDQTPVFSVSAAGVDIANSTHYRIFNEQDHSSIAQYTRIEFSTGMLVLWTVGGFVHALFDEFVWTLTACGCCLNHERLEWMQQYRKYANVMVVLLIALVASIASLIVVIRATLTENDDVDIAAIRSAGLADDSIEISKVHDASNFEFLISYAVELAVAWLVYWPAIETILFSGMLSCNGAISSFGGRPFELAQEENKELRRAKARSKDIESATS